MNILKIFPFIKFEIFNKEPSFVVKTNLLTKVIFLMKNHFKYQFKMLTCISGVDYPNNLYRFQVVYEILSLRFNSRTRIKCYVNELIPVNSIENIFMELTWWECEVWDMFGIFFNNHQI
jgi:NADH:ubiquinone oxidoreductase subunit C